MTALGDEQLYYLTANLKTKQNKTKRPYQPFKVKTNKQTNNRK